MANTITEKAMLAKLNISQWAASKHDKAITAEVAQAHGSDPSMGRYSKRLIAKDALDAIRGIAIQARHHHYENTLPWLDDGARILPAGNYFDYMAAQRDLQHKFEAAVADFVSVYPQLVSHAKASLNGLFVPEDYPTHQDIGGKFAFDVSMTPMPDADDFRVNLGDAEQSRIRADIQSRVNGAVEGAMSDLWTRIHDNVKRMAERLRAYEVDADGKVISTFRDSLVTNMRELCEMLPKLNFASSNSLEEMRGRLAAELCEFDAPVLRGDPDKRAEIAAKAEAILAEVSDFI
jgi:hypothetical protein